MQHDDEFILFLAEGLHRCQPIQKALEGLGVRYERHGDWFPRGTEDRVWLPVVGEKGWAVLTTDKGIRYNQVEISSVRRHKVREFVFASGNLSGQKMADILLQAIPEMKKVFRKVPPPFIASVTAAGHVHVRW